MTQQYIAVVLKFLKMNAIYCTQVFHKVFHIFSENCGKSSKTSLLKSFPQVFIQHSTIFGGKSRKTSLLKIRKSGKPFFQKVTDSANLDFLTIFGTSRFSQLLGAPSRTGGSGSAVRFGTARNAPRRGRGFLTRAVWTRTPSDSFSSGESSRRTRGPA